MTKKDLTVIQNELRTARDNMGCLLTDSGSPWDIQDAALCRMYYDLNIMCCHLGERIAAMDAEPAEIQLTDDVPGMVVAPAETPEREIDKDFDI